MPQICHQPSYPDRYLSDEPVILGYLRRKRSPPLAEGQLWKTNTGYVLIWHIGKRLIDYKMMKEPGQRAVRTQGTGIDTLAEYL